MKRIFFSLTALAGLLAASAAAAQTPTLLLKERDKLIRGYLQATPLPLSEKQRGYVEGQLNDLFDYEAIALASLGKHRSAANAKQLTEFVDVFSQVTRRNSSSQDSLETFLEGKIRYENESKDADGRTIVKTVVERRQDEIVVEYVFVRKDGKWRIVDYLLDDVGLVENYRSSFGKIITENGFPELTRRLRDKLKDDS